MIDVFPTVLDIAGIEKPTNIDGASLAPAVLGKGAAKPSRPAFAELRYVPFAEQRAANGDCLQYGLTASAHCCRCMRQTSLGGSPTSPRRLRHSTTRRRSA